MFSRLDKCDGPIFDGLYIQGGGGFIRDVKWVTYLGWGRIFRGRGVAY